MSARDVRQLAGELLHAAADRLLPRAVERRLVLVPEPAPIPHPLTAAQLATEGCTCANPYVVGGMTEDCPVHGVPAWLQEGTD